MADIDMTDAPSGSAGAVKKLIGKARPGGAADGTADGKKRFEVKKASNDKSDEVLIKEMLTTI